MSISTSYDERNRPYEPVGSARELLYSRDPEVCLVGPAGTGKTRANLEKLNLVCSKYEGAKWSYTGGESGPLKVGNAATAITLGKGRYAGVVPTQFADGHAKAMPYEKLVFDICNWTTDVDGAHPNCG